MEEKTAKPSDLTPTEYWSRHMVTTKEFETKQEVLDHLNWRASQYIDYLKYMPVNGQDGKVVLDYGCGPGNDLIGFSEFSKPAKVIAMDISQPAMDVAKKNLRFFEHSVEFHLINEHDNVIPLEDKSVDYIHCSGVLMCTTDFDKIMSEFRRVLKDDGEIAVMVYNYDSLWLHLYTAYMQPVLNKKFVGLPLMDAFRANTDGEDCPISTCYKPEEFIQKVSAIGFEGDFLGAAISIHEMKIARYRFFAIEHYDLDEEHRNFLSSLTFDERQIPHYKGQVAGIDACFRFRKC